MIVLLQATALNMLRNKSHHDCSGKYKYVGVLDKKAGIIRKLEAARRTGGEIFGYPFSSRSSISTKSQTVAAPGFWRWNAHFFAGGSEQFVLLLVVSTAAAPKPVAAFPMFPTLQSLNPKKKTDLTCADKSDSVSSELLSTTAVHCLRWDFFNFRTVRPYGRLGF